MYRFIFGDSIGNYQLSHNKGSVVFVDALNVIYKHSMKHIDEYKLTNDENKNIHIAGLYKFTTDILKHGILPIFVFDGRSPDEKKKTIEGRIENKIKSKELYEITENISAEEHIRLFKNSFYISRQGVEECKKLITMMGLIYVKAYSEADQQCAYLARKFEKYSLGVISDDWDIILYNTPVLLKNFSFKRHGNYTARIETTNLLTCFLEKVNIIRNDMGLLPMQKLTHNNFLEFNILLGSDYTVDNEFFKIDITYEELLTVCAMHEFNMVEVAKDIVKMEKYDCPLKMVKNLKSIKKIYTNYKVNEYESMTEFIPTKIDKESLFNYLYIVKKIDIDLINEKYVDVDKSFYALKKIMQKIDDDGSILTMKCYQFNYYCKEYNAPVLKYDQQNILPTYTQLDTHIYADKNMNVYDKNKNIGRESKAYMMSKRNYTCPKELNTRDDFFSRVNIR